jgi:hypothetical protein
LIPNSNLASIKRFNLTEDVQLVKRFVTWYTNTDQGWRSFMQTGLYEDRLGDYEAPPPYIGLLRGGRSQVACCSFDIPYGETLFTFCQLWAQVCVQHEAKKDPTKMVFVIPVRLKR